MNISHEEARNKGAFFVEENGKREAELAYFKPASDKMNIYHTEVDERLRGKGVGRELVKAAIDLARENGFKIIASCPYAKKIIENTAEFRELLIEK